jgi:DNA-binding NarL/FixJ family response regulator
MKILIVDADTLLRDGLSALLALEDGLEVIGAVDGTVALTQATFSVAPDLVILDIGIVDFEAGKTVAQLRERWPASRVLVLTFRRDDMAVRASLRAGVAGYLLKSDTRVELAHALRAIREGERYVSPSLSWRPEGARVTPVAVAALSERERLVMLRIAQGRRTREIATELSLSTKTIEKYRSNLMRKLGVKTAAAVAAFAIANGYVEL